MTKHSEEMLRYTQYEHTERQRLPRLVPSLAMTEYSIGSRNDDAMEFDTPKVHNAVNATDSNQGINLN